MARKRSWLQKHKQKFIDVSLMGLAALFVIAGGLFLWVSILEIPDLDAFEQRRILQSTKIYDRTGEVLLYDLHQDVRRTIVPYDDISHNIKNATIAIEDDTFFEHWGVRPFAIMRAAITNLRGGDLFGGQGGSTITQQVIKNALLEREKTITRKIKEAILAIRLEQVLSKEQILGHYLNESPYGGTVYGVEEASRSFFGKPASDVTLAEAAYLAALPQAPTYFSPYGTNREELEARKNFVLERMRSEGFITDEELTSARNEDVEFLPQTSSGIRAPHFVMYIREQLAEEYGEEALSERGFRVITTLDYDLQAEAEEIVRENALSNETQFNASNAALIALDPQTGGILTMVGSRDYFDDEIDGNYNATLALRQPGSSFKPFVYASAFSEGYTPRTTLFDVPTQFSTTCEPNELTSDDGCYAPVNYDGEFRGPVSMRNALAQSLNIPAVKTLYLTGIQDALKLARDAGISTFTDPDRYGLTLVLGGGEVRLMELASGYGVFANEGERNETEGILRIEDKDGNTIEEHEPNAERVMDRDVALQVSDILSDNTARTPLYGPNSLLHFDGRDVAAKTGTTNNYIDAWILGYTPNLVVGVWAGNNTPEPMNQISGMIVTPMWRDFMDVALEEIDEESFAQAPSVPNDIKPVLRSNGNVVDSEALAESLVEEGFDDELESGGFDLVEAIYDSVHSILHYVDKNDPRGSYPSNPSSDGQYRLWEYGVELWKDSYFSSLREDDGDDVEDVEDVENGDEESAIEDINSATEEMTPLEELPTE